MQTQGRQQVLLCDQVLIDANAGVVVCESAVQCVGGGIERLL